MVIPTTDDAESVRLCRLLWARMLRMSGLGVMRIKNVQHWGLGLQDVLLTEPISGLPYMIAMKRRPLTKRGSLLLRLAQTSYVQRVPTPFVAISPKKPAKMTPKTKNCRPKSVAAPRMEQQHNPFDRVASPARGHWVVSVRSFIHPCQCSLPDF